MAFPITAYAYDINKEDEETIERISNYLSKKTHKSVVLFSIDMKIHIKEKTHKDAICFGNTTLKLLEDTPKWKLQDIKKLGKDGTKEDKAAANKIFNEIIEYIKNYTPPAIKEETKIHTEKEEITFGKSEIEDIQITDKEIEYLTKLKDLLKGSKIIITKGDIKLEVE